VRIDIALAEFEDLYFDGALWTRGVDYEAREGSTALSVGADRLAAHPYGRHGIAAHFTGGRIVSFDFDLRDGRAGSGGLAGGGAAGRPAEGGAELQALPTYMGLSAIMLIALTLIVAGALVTAALARRR
jgi:hypothetical protein